MKHIHLKAGFISLVTLAVIIFNSNSYTQIIERRFIEALAPQHPQINVSGSALQKVALNNSQLLPIYGASEVLNQPSEFQPSQFFKTYPTGFTTFEVAKGGSASIIEAESLASIGEGLKNKKIVVSLTPSQFTSSAMSQKAYEGMFSKLHSNELIFSSVLSLETKQLAAKRMLDYPNPLNSDLVMKFAINKLSEGSFVSRILYYLIYPLGKLQTLIIDLQDQFQTISYINSQKKLTSNVTKITKDINWRSILLVAQKEQIMQANNNPYGFDNQIWDKRFIDFKVKPLGSGDKNYISSLNKSMEWKDFNILLKILKESGAQVLVLGRPLNRKYYNAIGISDEALSEFYNKLESEVTKYNFKIVDFKDYKDDKYFGVDQAPHTSREGWVHIDEVLNNFYHDKLV